VSLTVRSRTQRLYETERSVLHAARPGFRIVELQISSSRKLPWHYHTSVQDTFFVLQGCLKVFLWEPEEERGLAAGETYTVRPGRPHLVTNAGAESAVFLPLQLHGSAEYDFVPLS
jgi:quercetin dioxygenase-like cupin family protein